MKVRVLGLLGMHRSGTSCLMAALEQAGVSAGRVTKRNIGNPSGNREIVDVWLLHERLLEANGGNWRNPPQRVVWRARDRAARDQIVRRHFKDDRLWGFKDPRLVFVLDGWVEAYPQMEWIGVFRHPLAVAASLASRDGLAGRKAIRIWCRYNEQLLKVYSERGPFPLVSFDLHEDDYVARVNSVLYHLDLQSIQGFFDASSRHHVYGTESVPPGVKCQQLYRRLLTLAG